MDDQTKVHRLGLLRHCQGALEIARAVLGHSAHHPALSLQLLRREGAKGPFDMVSMLLEHFPSFLKPSNKHKKKTTKKDTQQKSDQQQIYNKTNNL